MGRFILPLPAYEQVLPEMTDEMRALAIAHMDELLAHTNDPLPDGEQEWDPRELFPRCFG